jgi:hypothetical protein
VAWGLSQSDSPHKGYAAMAGGAAASPSLGASGMAERIRRV